MSKKMSSIDLSIIITAHHEGIVAHKTILSVLQATKELEKQNISYEIVIGLDRPNKETKGYYTSHWGNDARFLLVEGSFGNPADNRNNAFKYTKGQFVSLLDGDDLISRNWLLESYNLAKKSKKPTVIRPHMHLHFGFDEPVPILWIMADSFSKEEDALVMTYWNRWTVVATMPRTILEENSYRSTLNGFGFEDYLWNCDTRAKGIQHKIALDTVFFYRRRRSSVTAEHMGTILPKSDLFDSDFIKSINGNKYEKEEEFQQKSKTKRLIKRGYRFAYDITKRTPFIKRIVVRPVANTLYNLRRKQLPTSLFEAWKDINSIENQLYPTHIQVAQMQFHPLSFNQKDMRAGLAYKKVIDSMSSGYVDYIFLVPELSGHGGTEKLIRNYITALHQIHPEWNIAIFSRTPLTEQFKKANPFPDNIDVIDFGGITREFTDYERKNIWSRFLVQTGVKQLHLVNDEFWYRWIRDHMTLMGKNGFSVNVSLFMREYTHEKDRILSFSDPYLAEIWPIVNKVFTDNERVITDSLTNNAFEREKFIVHYQPQDLSLLMKPRDIDSKKPLRILWASRVSFQKRPDILKAIATQLDKNDFVVDAYGFLQHYKSSFFKDSNVNYKGSFSGGISSIPLDTYDVYLYTSDTDGVPNILLEIAAAGLPIVASNAGGVGEFVKNNKTGKLVEVEDIEGYVKALQGYKNNPQKAKEMATNAQKLLKKQHSMKHFIQSVKKDI